MSARYRGIHLRVEQWPAPDRATWEELFREGNVLDGCGAAYHWAEATRRTNLKHYARWLGWLSANGELDPELNPFRRADPDKVNAYAQMLKETLSPRACFRDHWTQMRIAENVSRTELALAEGPNETLQGLGGAYDATDPEEHLRQVGPEWHLSFEAHETKTRQPLRYVVAPALVLWLEFYLAEVRPGFKRACCDDRLWPGSKGRPLAYETLYSRVLLATERLFGLAITPHSFRTIAATALADRSPSDALFARALLGHRSPSTTERHYIRANQLLASVRINAILRNVRDGGLSKR